MDPRVKDLIYQQSAESQALFKQFIEQYPLLEFEDPSYEWPDDVTVAWWDFTAEQSALHKAERDALADELGL
jgi:hypothetical protein